MRTIHTQEELKALAVGSVFRDSDQRIWAVAEFCAHGGPPKTLEAMGISTNIALHSYADFPAVVLWEPTEKHAA